MDQQAEFLLMAKPPHKMVNEIFFHVKGLHCRHVSSNKTMTCNKCNLVYRPTDLTYPALKDTLPFPSLSFSIVMYFIK